MPFAFYMDHNVDDRITDGLRSRGIDVILTREEGRSEDIDPSLLDRAAELERVFFTHDEDFMREGARRQRLGIHFYGVIFGHQKANIGRCIAGLVKIYESHDQEYMMNVVMYVP